MTELLPREPSRRARSSQAASSSARESGAISPRTGYSPSQPSANASSVGYFRFSQAANFSRTGGLKVVLSVGSFQMFQLSSMGEERKRVTSSRIRSASGSRTSGRSSEG